MTVTNNIIHPAENLHLKNQITGEIYPDYIVLAKSLTETDLTEVSEEEYQLFLTHQEEVSDSEALEIITEGP